MTEKTGAEVIVEKLDETKSQVEDLANKTADLAEKTVSEMKSVGDSIALGLKEAFAAKADDEIKSLKDQLANKEAEMKSLRSGEGVSANALEVKSTLSQALSDCANDDTFKVKNLKSFLEQKSGGVVGFDARRGGIFLKQPKVYGEIINLFPRAKGISSLIKNVDARSDLIVKRKDNSRTSIYQTFENKVATEGKPNKYTEVKISQTAESVKIPVSAEMLKEIKRGETTFDLISEQVNDLVDLYTYKKDQVVVTKSIAKSQVSGSAFKKKLTSSNDVNNANWGFQDILAGLSLFEKFYRTPNLVFVGDQSYLDQVFAKVASDGHGNMEYFDFSNPSGFTGLKTASGVIPLIGIDSEFFKNYKKFDNNLAATSNTADEGFVFGGNAADNGGKVLGMFVDLNKSMLMSEDSNIFEVGLYQDAKDTYDQEAFFGLYGSYGTDVILEASMGVLVHRN